MQSKIIHLLKHEEEKFISKVILDDVNLEQMSDNFKEFLEGNQEVQELALKNCNFSSLQNFPFLSNLNKLVLTKNPLTKEDLGEIKKFETLQILDLTEVKSLTLRDICSLSTLKNLLCLNIESALIQKEEEK